MPEVKRPLMHYDARFLGYDKIDAVNNGKKIEGVYRGGPSLRNTWFGLCTARPFRYDVRIKHDIGFDVWNETTNLAISAAK